MSIERSEKWTALGKAISITADEPVTETLQQLMLEDRIVDIKTVSIYNKTVAPLWVEIGNIQTFIPPFNVKFLPIKGASYVKVQSEGQLFEMNLLPFEIPEGYYSDYMAAFIRDGMLDVFVLDNDKLQ
jgi:hypothetical protein